MRFPIWLAKLSFGSCRCRWSFCLCQKRWNWFLERLWRCFLSRALGIFAGRWLGGPQLYWFISFQFLCNNYFPLTPPFSLSQSTSTHTRITPYSTPKTLATTPVEVVQFSLKPNTQSVDHSHKINYSFL